MAHIYGTSLFCLMLFWLANSNPAFAESLGGSCNNPEGCTNINNSTCNSNYTCVCESGFVADSTNKTCLSVAKEHGSDCEEKSQCSELGALFDCVEKKCTVKKEESSNIDKCPNETCHTDDEKKRQCANGNCTTTTNPSTRRVDGITKPTAAGGGKTAEKKSSGGSSVVQMSFLAVIWVVHLVM